MCDRNPTVVRLIQGGVNTGVGSDCMPEYPKNMQSKITYPGLLEMVRPLKSPASRAVRAAF